MPALANAMGEVGEDKVPELEAIGDFLGETDTVSQLNQDNIDYVADAIEQAISRRY